jgi:hypothetical protein
LQAVEHTQEIEELWTSRVGGNLDALINWHAKRVSPRSKLT